VASRVANLLTACHCRIPYVCGGSFALLARQNLRVAAIADNLWRTTVMVKEHLRLFFPQRVVTQTLTKSSSFPFAENPSPSGRPPAVPMLGVRALPNESQGPGGSGTTESRCCASVPSLLRSPDTGVPSLSLRSLAASCVTEGRHLRSCRKSLKTSILAGLVKIRAAPASRNVS
jgi:hypothetical protein